MIEILQINKFKESVKVEAGQPINVLHKIGENQLSFRLWPDKDDLATYSVLLRNEFGAMEARLLGSQGLWELGGVEVMCADPGLFNKLAELWAPRDLEEEETPDEG